MSSTKFLVTEYYLSKEVLLSSFLKLDFTANLLPEFLYQLHS